MVHNKRKKNSRQRGSWTHGWGAKKKHRGAGHRGGRGNAGKGKKGDARKPAYWADKVYLGKIGFHSVTATKVNSINLSHIESVLDSWQERGIAKKNGNMIVVNLKEQKVQKLLGTGNIRKGVHIIVEQASKGAIAKVEAAGSTLTLLKKEEKKATSKKEEEN